MSLDRLELLAVWLGSGRVYLVPRALLENLMQSLPVSAPQLIVSASTSGGPLDLLAGIAISRKLVGPPGFEPRTKEL